MPASLSQIATARRYRRRGGCHARRLHRFRRRGRVQLLPQSRRTDARSANATWKAKGYPGTRGWYDWPGGNFNYAGGTNQNRAGELPAGHSFREFDVYPRAGGAVSDAFGSSSI